MTYLFFKDKFFVIKIFIIMLSHIFNIFFVLLYFDVYKKLHKIEILINLIYSFHVLGG